MPSIAVLGATGNLGRHVAREALQHGWDLSVAVRSRGRLAPEIAARARSSACSTSTCSAARAAAPAGELKIIEAILQRAAIGKILTHLGLDPRPPPRARASEAGHAFAAG